MRKWLEGTGLEKRTHEIVTPRTEAPNKKIGSLGTFRTDRLLLSGLYYDIKLKKSTIEYSYLYRLQNYIAPVHRKSL